MLNKEKNQRLAVVSSVTMAFFLLSCDSVFAGAIAETFCSTVAIMLDVGRGIATLGVAVLGIAALLGKITWGQGALVITGIGVMFGGAALILDLTPMIGTSTVSMNTITAGLAAPAYAFTALSSLGGCGVYTYTVPSL